MGDDKYKKRVNLQLSSAFSLLCVEIYLCNDLKNFINKMGLINLENQYAAKKKYVKTRSEALSGTNTTAAEHWLNKCGPAAPNSIYGNAGNQHRRNQGNCNHNVSAIGIIITMVVMVSGIDTT